NLSYTAYLRSNGPDLMERRGTRDLISALASGSNGSGSSPGLLTGKARWRGASTADVRRKLAGTTLQSSKSTRISRGRERGLWRILPGHSRAAERRGGRSATKTRGGGGGSSRREVIRDRGGSETRQMDPGGRGE